jgi:hypothetical protein
MNSSAKSADFPLAGDVRGQSSPQPQRDPYESLWDLMLVVEELCPAWPERGTFETHHTFLL